MTSLWINPTGGRIRSDAAGDGHFGARRRRNGVSVPGGHHGLDLLCDPGQRVIAPLDALLTRDGFAYSDTRIWRLLVLTAGDLELKLMYVQPLPQFIGERVKAGQDLGFAQDIRDRYHDPAMLAHVHLELRKGRTLVDPTPFLFA